VLVFDVYLIKLPDDRVRLFENFATSTLFYRLAGLQLADRERPRIFVLALDRQHVPAVGMAFDDYSRSGRRNAAEANEP
jgi:hypothetical protein